MSNYLSTYVLTHMRQNKNGISSFEILLFSYCLFYFSPISWPKQFFYQSIKRKAIVIYDSLSFVIIIILFTKKYTFREIFALKITRISLIISETPSIFCCRNRFYCKISVYICCRKFKCLKFIYNSSSNVSQTYK